MNKENAGLSDTELAVLAQGGDVSAFEAIYDRHADSTIYKTVEVDR